MKTIKIFIVSIFILNLMSPLLVLGQTQGVTPPKTLEEAKELGQNAAEVTKEKIPGLMQRIWENEVLPLWKKMYDWVRTHIWDNWLGPWLKNLWTNILKILKIEVEQRKPGVQEEFQKEKQELKEEAPVVGKTLWEKFQELIK